MTSAFSERDFERAYARCYTGFVTWAQRAAGVDRDTAEDLVCQARLTAWGQRDRYDPGQGCHTGLPASFRHWAGRILVLVCRTYRRNLGRQPRNVPIDTILDGPSCTQPCCRASAEAGLSTDLQAGLDALPTPLRDVVDLHLNNHTLTDIALMLSIHRNTVSNRLEEAGQRLRVAFPGFVPDVDDWLIRECSEVTLYSRPSAVWDHSGTSAQVQARRRQIRVTNGFTEAPKAAVWTEYPDILQPLKNSGR